jgi:DNA-binding phage protein
VTDHPTQLPDEPGDFDAMLRRTFNAAKGKEPVRAVAQRAGMSKSSLGRLLSGETAMSTQAAHQIAQALGLSLIVQGPDIEVSQYLGQTTELVPVSGTSEPEPAPFVPDTGTECPESTDLVPDTGTECREVGVKCDTSDGHQDEILERLTVVVEKLADIHDGDQPVPTETPMTRESITKSRDQMLYDYLTKHLLDNGNQVPKHAHVARHFGLRETQVKRCEKYKELYVKSQGTVRDIPRQPKPRRVSKRPEDQA